ncbi:MAG TPA: AI-2E family transporter [Candidatus Onthocola stercorigallinarum]|nr:AI-2E family transporter [Candidatus Onthocola stercorigallinarum]
MKKVDIKDIKKLVIMAIVLIFAFIYISEIWSFVKFVIRIFMPFIIGLAIAFVLNVLMNTIENKWFKKWKASTKVKRPISLLVSIALVLGFIVFLLLLIIPNLQNTIELFADSIPAYSRSLQNLLNGWGIDADVINNVREVLDSLGNSLADYIKDNSNQLISTTLGIASNVVSAFVNVTIGFVFAIYFLAQKEKITSQFNKVMDAYLPKKRVNKIKEIAHLSNKVFSSFVSGQCMEAIIIGVLCFFGMVILRLPYASTISVLVGFTALIPVFGAFIGTIFGAFLIFMVSPLQAIIFVMFIIILQQLEGNLIYPKVVGKSVGLPGIWVLVAVSVGASINGVLGMLLSVPICSIIYSILATNVRIRLEDKNKTNKKVQA